MHYFKYIFILFFIFNKAVYAQHEPVEFKTKTIVWNGIHFEVAEESAIIINNKKQFKLKAQEQEMLIHKQKTKNQDLSAYKTNFAKQKGMDINTIYAKETAFFNAIYGFSNEKNRFAIYIVLQKKTALKDIYNIDMHMESIQSILTPEHIDALVFMVNNMLEKLKL